MAFCAAHKTIRCQPECRVRNAYIYSGMALSAAYAVFAQEVHMLFCVFYKPHVPTVWNRVIQLRLDAAAVMLTEMNGMAKSRNSHIAKANAYFQMRMVYVGIFALWVKVKWFAALRVTIYWIRLQCSTNRHIIWLKSILDFVCVFWLINESYLTSHIFFRMERAQIYLYGGDPEVVGVNRLMTKRLHSQLATHGNECFASTRDHADSMWNIRAPRTLILYPPLMLLLLYITLSVECFHQILHWQIYHNSHSITHLASISFRL